jgi:hypothetical protein
MLSLLSRPARSIRRRSLGLERLEAREVCATHLSSALAPGVLPLGNASPVNAQVETITPRSEVQVEGRGAIGAAPLMGSAGTAASNPAVIDALLGAGGYGGPAAPASQLRVTGPSITLASTVDLSGRQQINVSGTWYINGQKCTITQEGNKLKLTNERGQRSEGSLRSDGKVVVNGWGNLIGTLSHNNTQIDWANGTRWTRQQINLSGVWYINGHKCTITQEGNKLWLTNERGLRTEGLLRDDGKVVAYAAKGWDKLIGTLSRNSTQIDWGNGTQWKRSR